MSRSILLGARAFVFSTMYQLSQSFYPSALHTETALKWRPNKRLTGQKTGRFSFHRVTRKSPRKARKEEIISRKFQGNFST